MAQLIRNTHRMLLVVLLTQLQINWHEDGMLIANLGTSGAHAATAKPADSGKKSHGDDHDHTADHGHNADHRNQTDAQTQHGNSPEEHNVEHQSEWTITQPGYDIRDRPHGPVLSDPVEVKVTVYSNFIEEINEKNGEITFALFTTVSWHDPRLKPLNEILNGVNGYRDNGAFLPGEMKKKLWVPDVYLPMAREVVVPTVQQPTEAIKIRQNNTVEYTAFFVVTFKCPMSYKSYPMDEQACDLDFMSYSHTTADIRLKWAARGLEGAHMINTKHFLVHIIRPKGKSRFVRHQQGESKDILRIMFHLKRHQTYHMIQTYLPSIMLVIVGWLSLLVPLDFAYGRMVLSVTTLLVLVSIFVTTSQSTPGVNEVKALDVWLFMCIFFVFSAIVDCIVDLRFLSMVEKESQIAGETEMETDRPPIVDEQLRESQSTRSTADAVSDAQRSYSIVFRGSNTPFQMCLCFNILFLPCWSAVLIVAFHAKFDRMDFLNRYIYLTVLVGALLMEAARLYVGCFGNLREDVPDLAGF